MSYNGYITRIKNVRKHSNADKLQCGECFGNTTIIGLDIQDNEVGLYFPTDGKLGLEFATVNKLVRTKDENGNHLYGYLEPDKLHVSTIKLRGEKSDGLFMPLSSLETFTDINKLKEGDTITILNGIVICEKYVPRGQRRNHSQGNGKGTKNTKVESESYPLFKEHSDTSQFAYNTQQFKEGDLLYITLKQHGTSGRTTHTIKEKKAILPYWIYKTLKLCNIELKSKKSWEYISGTRRVILKNYAGGFYNNDEFRKKWHNFFVGKLHKGETVYYEIVGWVNDNQLIMPECNNAKTKDKEFIKQYGETTRFTYGCEQGQNDIYVYRMTITNEDGVVVEYPWELVKLRCEQMAVKHCPELDKLIFTTVEDLTERVNRLCEGTDPIGKIHIREGVVVRIEGKEKFAAYKHKNFQFKVLESIVKLDDVLDMEEAESEEMNNES